MFLGFGRISGRDRKMAIDDWSKIARLVALVAVMTVSPAATGQSSQDDKVYRIGFIAFGPRPVETVMTSPLDAFRQTLRERGYVEGENLILDELWPPNFFNSILTSLWPLVLAQFVRPCAKHRKFQLSSRVRPIP